MLTQARSLSLSDRGTRGWSNLIMSAPMRACRAPQFPVHLRHAGRQPPIVAFIKGEGSAKKKKEEIRSVLDAGKSRAPVITKFYDHPSRTICEELLTDDCVIREGLAGSSATDKKGFMHMLLDVVLPAVPDFSWDAATTGEADEEGYVLVIIAASGHHTGVPYALHGLPPVPPSGRHFCLSEQAHKVRTEGGRIKEIQMIPARGAGPLALYKALGGILPAAEAGKDGW